jgi:hypothetical protein
MEIKKAETKLDQADSFLTKLKDILKKHWGILILLSIGYFFYWAFTTDFEEDIEEPKIEQVQQISKGKQTQQLQTQQVQEPAGDYYIIKQTYFIDDYGYRKGDTVFVDKYSDGVIDKYYTDHQTYVDDYPKK